MAPFASPDDAAQNPTAQVAEFTVAQQTARLAALREGMVNFAVAPRIAARAQMAEQGLDAGSQFAAESQRRRIEAGIGLPLDFPSAPEDNPEAELAMQEAQNDWEANMEDSRQDEDYGNPRFGSIAENARNQAESLLDSPVISEALDSGVQTIYAAAFQGGGVVDSAWEDSGIMYGIGTAGTVYQTVLTIFPDWNEQMRKSPIGRYLPQKFNLKTKEGWTQLVAGIWLIIEGLAIFTILMAIVSIIAIGLMGLAEAFGLVDFFGVGNSLLVTPNAAQPTP